MLGKRVHSIDDIFGISEAMFFRLVDTVFGVIYGFVFELQMIAIRYIKVNGLIRTGICLFVEFIVLVSIVYYQLLSMVLDLPLSLLTLAHGRLNI